MLHPKVKKQHVERVPKTKAGNQISILYPYKKRTIWYFDDDDVDLVAEPFVGNINKMIDMFVGGSKNAIIHISHSAMPEYNVKMVKCEAPDGFAPDPGWYQMAGTNETGWLCPALLKYFDGYPDQIYANIKADEEA